MALLLRGCDVSVIIYGGAYEGSFSRAAARAFSNAKIHAFEPTPASFALLEERTRDVPAIIRHRLALGAVGGVATLFTNTSPLPNSLRARSPMGHRYFPGFVEQRDAVAVEVVTMADFAETHGIEVLDILKLDCQGHELDALAGLGARIGTVRVVLAEVQFVVLYDGAPLFSDVELWLRGKDFAFYQFYGLVRSPDDGRLLYGDAMFVRSELVRGD